MLCCSTFVLFVVSDVSNEPYALNGALMLRFIRALMLFIVKSMMPLSLVDEEAFIQFIQFFDPRVRVPCKATITNSNLPDLYNEARSKLLVELQLVKHVALTTDCWTSRTHDSFMTVTIHYIK